MLKKIYKIKANEVQIQLIIFIAFIIFGSLYANIIINNNINNYNIIYDFFKSKIQGNIVVKTDLFEFLLFNRFKVLFFLWIIGFILFTNSINYILTSYYGFSFGTIFSTSLMYNGISSYLLTILLFIPHYLIYIPIFIYITKQNVHFSKSLYKNRKVSKLIKMNGQLLLEYFLVLTICGLFLLIGVFLESYINPDILKWYISIKNI